MSRRFGELHEGAQAEDPLAIGIALERRQTRPTAVVVHEEED
jgi:hypothetical protein